MDREELVNSNSWKISKASIEYWRKHNETEGLDEAFEAGADFQQQLDLDRTYNFICNKMMGEDGTFTVDGVSFTENELYYALKEFIEK